MIIKRYIGKDSAEVMQKVKASLGSDAIILNERKIRKRGLWGLFKKPCVEILAAIDEDTNIPKNKVEQIPRKNRSIKNNYIYNDSINEINQNTNNVNNSKKENINEKGKEINKLEKKVKNMENMLNTIYSQMQKESALNKDEKSSDNSFASNKKTSFIMKQSKIVQIFANNLLNNSVDNDIVKEILNNANGNISDENNINDIQSCIYESIVKELGLPEPISSEGDKCKKIIFLGPTGVGKTTTLAKIAAIFAVNNNKDVGIISADTYRIAAVEQLKTYAKILKLPVNVVYSPEEVPAAVELFKDKDIVLIDTAGSSYKNVEQFDEVKQIVKITEPDEVFLLISLTTDKKVCNDIINSYGFLEDYKVLFTKLDEATSSGTILNIKKKTNKSLSYITTGQSVPDDIMVADVEQITNSMLGSLRI